MSPAPEFVSPVFRFMLRRIMPDLVSLATANCGMALSSVGLVGLVRLSCDRMTLDLGVPMTPKGPPIICSFNRNTMDCNSFYRTSAMKPRRISEPESTPSLVQNDFLGGLPTRTEPVIPPLASVRLHSSMNEEERAKMIKKRNAVYSKRKYYRKKMDIMRLIDQRKECEDKNASLKQEQQRLKALLRSSQSLIEAKKAADAEALSLGTVLPAARLSAVVPWMDERSLVVSSIAQRCGALPDSPVHQQLMLPPTPTYVHDQSLLMALLRTRQLGNNRLSE